MPKKCEHLEECDHCAKQIPEPPSEPVSRIQQILTTLEQAQAALAVATSNEMRYKLSIESGIKSHRKAVEAAETALDQTRKQLAVELQKFDAGLTAAPVPEAKSA